MPDEPFLSTHAFSVHVSLSGPSADSGILNNTGGAFSDVTGLEINIEHREIREGGYLGGSRQLIGKTSHPVLIFKRGVTIDSGFWQWIQRCLNGTYPIPYMSGEITVYPSAGIFDTAAIWTFTDGMVTKVKSADLAAARATTVAIEELHIAHERLERIQ